MDSRKIGNLISSLRKEKGLSQQALSDILGVSPKTISKWECAKGLPDISMLKKISEVFDITTDELLEGSIINKKSINKSKDKNISKNKKKLIIGIMPLLIIALVIVVFIIVNHSSGNNTTNNCTVIRTYYIDNIGKSSDENYLYITIHEFQVEGTYTIKLPKIIAKDLEVGSSYEFTFKTSKNNLLIPADKLFANSEIINLKYSDKEGLERTSKYYCDRESE